MTSSDIIGSAVYGMAEKKKKKKKKKIKRNYKKGKKKKPWGKQNKTKKNDFR
jgi:hypothetical protein